MALAAFPGRNVMDPELTNLLLWSAVYVVGNMLTLYVIWKRNHLDNVWWLAFLCWPLALIVSLCIPVVAEKKQNDYSDYHNQGKSGDK
jgi:hypothetical protein